MPQIIMVLMIRGIESLEPNSTIASLSRTKFKHKQTKQTISLVLEHGSLLIMKGDTQTNSLHSLPKSKKITGSRINLTFRTMSITNPSPA